MKKNNSGMALVIVILISALALILVGIMLWLTIGGTKISGMGSQYKSAQDAAKGASEIVISMLKFNPTTNCNNNNLPPTLDLPSSDYTISNPNCVNEKLNCPTFAWVSCNSSNNNPDIIMTLGSYTVYATIILTQVILPQKNNDPSIYYYTVKINAFNQQNESANISFVYKIPR